MKNTIPARRRGFTLVEMLAVVAIIVILAALIVGGMKIAGDKTNSNKAKLQVALLSKAIEEYALDHGGVYPPSQNPSGENETTNLRQLLFLDGRDDQTKAKRIYLPELEETSKQGWITGSGTSAKITDPWGNEYRFRSGKASTSQGFDVWSIGKDGKTKEDDRKAKESLDDIWN